MSLNSSCVAAHSSKVHGSGYQTFPFQSWYEEPLSVIRCYEYES